eukprot:5034437-Prymnesium_polylepis.1
MEQEEMAPSAPVGLRGLDVDSITWAIARTLGAADDSTTMRWERLAREDKPFGQWRSTSVQDVHDDWLTNLPDAVFEECHEAMCQLIYLDPEGDLVQLRRRAAAHWLAGEEAGRKQCAARP